MLQAGLGINLSYHDDLADANELLDTLKEAGYKEIRVHLPDYANSEHLANDKAVVQMAVAKGFDVIWGVSSNPTIIDNTTWPTFRAAVLAAAQWSQDNGVYEFQIGNEEESHVDELEMTIEQLATNLKDLATDVKLIFTRGLVSYSCVQWSIDWLWVFDKGDIDILATNMYKEYGYERTQIPWKERIALLYTAYGANGFYVSEFNLSATETTAYSVDEDIQASDTQEMIDYFKGLGIERMLFFYAKGDEFGLIKYDDSKRRSWYQMLEQRSPATRESASARIPASARTVKT